MTITLVPAHSADEFVAPVLRSRAWKAPRLSTVHLLRAMAGGTEEALVVLDIHSGSDCVILYEIFLCSERRNRGIGTKVLSAIEAYAKASGVGCVEVWPRSLDSRDRSDAQLERWYRGHGYVSAQAGSERLRKVLPPA
ncbi:MAG: N-acetyltransferase [Gemmatimonadetes bacterium]|nr:N-acetyltransferase [Gemmatimonadota bacterium]